MSQSAVGNKANKNILPSGNNSFIGNLFLSSVTVKTRCETYEMLSLLRPLKNANVENTFVIQEMINRAITELKYLKRLHVHADLLKIVIFL